MGSGWAIGRGGGFPPARPRRDTATADPAMPGPRRKSEQRQPWLPSAQRNRTLARGRWESEIGAWRKRAKDVVCVAPYKASSNSEDDP